MKKVELEKRFKVQQAEMLERYIERKKQDVVFKR